MRVLSIDKFRNAVFPGVRNDISLAKDFLAVDKFGLMTEYIGMNRRNHNCKNMVGSCIHGQMDRWRNGFESIQS